jgi:hypothetical protein
VLGEELEVPRERLVALRLEEARPLAQGGLVAPPQRHRAEAAADEQEHDGPERDRPLPRGRHELAHVDLRDDEPG